MAIEYFNKLSALIETLGLEPDVFLSLKVKHYFSGAALYTNDGICATLSPAGLAFKLPEKDVRELLGSGIAVPLKYFSRGHIKKEYALFESPDLTQTNHWRKYLIEAIQFAQ